MYDFAILFLYGYRSGLTLCLLLLAIVFFLVILRSITMGVRAALWLMLAVAVSASLSVGFVDSMSYGKWISTLVVLDNVKEYSSVDIKKGMPGFSVINDLRTQPFLDPYSGHPLHYACLNNEVKVWSVGPDLLDNGGHPIPAAAAAFSPGTPPWHILFFGETIRGFLFGHSPITGDVVVSLKVLSCT